MPGPESVIFDWTINPADLTPKALLELPEEEQIERLARLMGDIQSFADIQVQSAQTASVTLMAPDTPITYVNAPSGGAAEWAGAGTWRAAVDLSPYTECRLSAVVTAAGATGGEAAIEAAPSGSFDFLDGGDGPKVPLDAPGLLISEWRPIRSGYRTDVVLRVVSVAGNDTADPALGTTVVQFR